MRQEIYRKVKPEKYHKDVKWLRDEGMETPRIQLLKGNLSGVEWWEMRLRKKASVM